MAEKAGFTRRAPSAERGEDAAAALSRAAMNLAVPSMALSAMLPAKPQETMTSWDPSRMSEPSQLPAKSTSPASAASSRAPWNARAWELPLVSSVPLESSATVGCPAPASTSARTAPICANCTTISGRQSALAPRSQKTV